MNWCRIAVPRYRFPKVFLVTCKSKQTRSRKSSALIVYLMEQGVNSKLFFTQWRSRSVRDIRMTLLLLLAIVATLTNIAKVNNPEIKHGDATKSWWSNYSSAQNRHSNQYSQDWTFTFTILVTIHTIICCKYVYIFLRISKASVETDNLSKACRLTRRIALSKAFTGCLGTLFQGILLVYLLYSTYDARALVEVVTTYCLAFGEESVSNVSERKLSSITSVI